MRIKSFTGSIRKKITLKNYEFLFTRFSDEFRGRDLESITPDEILSFLTRLTEGTKQTTKRNRYSCLKAFFNYIRNTIDFEIQNPFFEMASKKAGKLAGVNLRAHDLR
ncbi:MAG: phage integrase N-terminal SAM-like domain-containing protein [Desulfobacterales bacterium]|nr:MAG: phage integrase N-terminal SAM-like domain-containing protein [Desulfobacterales bacterium]